MNPFTRKGRVRPQLVKVTGRYGDPWLGVKASPERNQRQPDGTTIRVVDVVTCRYTPAAPPRRITVACRFVSPLHIYACPTGVLENLTKCGALTMAEYQALLAERLDMIREAESLERVCRPSRARREVSPWHNIGKGQITREARRFIR